MRGDSGKSDSPWKIPDVSFPALTGNTLADVCVVGAGITGISCAYQLTRQGFSVVVVDDGPLGGGETCRTTAHLSDALDDRYEEIEKIHGVQAARLAAESHRHAIDRIEEIVREEHIACDFARVDGFLFKDPQQDLQILKEELNASHRAGLSDVEWVFQAPLPGIATGPALRFPRQAQMDPLRYLEALARSIVANGGKIFTHTHISNVSGGKTATAVSKAGFAIEARAVIVATNTPFNDWVVLHTKQAAYRTYVIAARIPRDSVKKALYWDTQNPYHYVRVVSAGHGEKHDLLLVGGEDHRTGQDDDPAERFRSLENWAMERFPKIVDVKFRWSGQVMEPMDGLAFIGKNPMDADNVYIATGDSGMGMTHATIAAMILTQLIRGRDHEWARLYDPSRKTLRSLGNFLKENANTAAQYADWIHESEVDSLDQIPKGEGAIFGSRFHKTAVYRDKNGNYHSCSAVCPHLGGIVSWNSAEKTWDCPCHGSRFDAYGGVINGPSERNLSSVKIEVKTKANPKGGRRKSHHPHESKANL